MANMNEGDRRVAPRPPRVPHAVTGQSPATASEPDLTPELAWAMATGGPWPDPERLDGDARFMALAL